MYTHIHTQIYIYALIYTCNLVWATGSLRDRLQAQFRLRRSHGNCRLKKRGEVGRTAGFPAVLQGASRTVNSNSLPTADDINPA